MEIEMDWKLDKQRREKNQALLKKGSAQDVDLLSDMEREFEQIFGGVNARFTLGRGRAGDPVRRSETLSQHKAQKGA
jgi:hypothetical protein